MGIDIIDDFIFYPDKDKEKQKEGIFHTEGKFASKEKMSKWNEKLLDGQYVLRISFT